MTQHILPTLKALIAYPTMDRANYVLIENLRIKHRSLMYTMNQDLALPHFVLHGKNAIEKDGLVDKIAIILKDVLAFDFTIRYSIITRYLVPSYKVVLVPTEGLHRFIQLQHVLCANVFTKPIPSEFFSVPYVHIAWINNLAEAKACMNQINQGELEITGRIDKLTLKEWEKDNFSVPTIHEFTLKS